MFYFTVAIIVRLSCIALDPGPCNGLFHLQCIPGDVMAHGFANVSSFQISTKDLLCKAFCSALLLTSPVSQETFWTVACLQSPLSTCPPLEYLCFRTPKLFLVRVSLCRSHFSSKTKFPSIPFVGIQIQRWPFAAGHSSQPHVS